MTMNHDLKVITGNPLAEMNHVQKGLLAEIGLIFSRCLKNDLSFNVSSYSNYSCEAQCVVLLDCPLYPEWITRGRNMLIIVNNK